MNKFQKVQIICWSIVFIVFIGLALWFASRTMSGGTGGNNVLNIVGLSGPFEEVGRYNIDSSDIDGIDIDWVSGSVTVIPYEASDITLVEFAQRSLEEDEVMEYKVSGAKLSVKFSANNIKLFDKMPSKKMEVFIPYRLAESIKGLDVNTVSAYVEISGINSEDFSVSTVSGNCDAHIIKSNKINISTTSGNISLKNCVSDSITSNTVSGRVNIYDVDSERLSFNTTSGDVTVSDTFTTEVSHSSVSGVFDFDGELKKLNANSTSGKIDLKNRIVPEEIDIDTVSGRINVAMPKADDIKVSHNTISGKFNCDFPVSMNKSGSSYSFSTGSGDIDIEELK